MIGYKTIIKFFLLLLIICFFCFYGYAQDSTANVDNDTKTILKLDKKEFNFYGTIWGGYPMFSYGKGFTAGVDVAWLVGNSFGIGIGATAINNGKFWLCGGLHLEPIIKPNFWFHVSFPLIAGFGLAEEQEALYSTGETINNYDTFMYLEPGIQVEFNPFRFMRIGTGARVHLTSGFTKINGYNKTNCNGVSLYFFLKFGKFKNFRKAL